MKRYCKPINEYLTNSATEVKINKKCIWKFQGYWRDVKYWGRGSQKILLRNIPSTRLNRYIRVGRGRVEAPALLLMGCRGPAPEVLRLSREGAFKFHYTFATSLFENGCIRVSVNPRRNFSRRQVTLTSFEPLVETLRAITTLTCSVIKISRVHRQDFQIANRSRVLSRK